MDTKIEKTPKSKSISREALDHFPIFLKRRCLQRISAHFLSGTFSVGAVDPIFTQNDKKGMNPKSLGQHALRVNSKLQITFLEGAFSLM